MLRVQDPFNNKNVISGFLSNYLTIYVWCYIPTGLCLVEQSTQRQQWTKDKYSGYARVPQYFDENTLTLTTTLRRSTKFLYYYGFSSITLTPLRMDPSIVSPSQVSQMKQYFIDHLHYGLNVQLNVFDVNKSSAIINTKQSLLMQASGKS